MTGPAGFGGEEGTSLHDSTGWERREWTVSSLWSRGDTLRVEPRKGWTLEVLGDPGRTLLCSPLGAVRPVSHALQTLPCVPALRTSPHGERASGPDVWTSGRLDVCRACSSSSPLILPWDCPRPRPRAMHLRLPGPPPCLSSRRPPVTRQVSSHILAPDHREFFWQ